MRRFLAVSMLIAAFFLTVLGGAMEINGGKGGGDGLIEWNGLPVEEDVAGKQDDGLIEWNDFTMEEYS